jgi:hypothetical protein
MQHVRVQTLGGRSLNLSLAKDCSISDIKKHIKSEWNVSADHQKLIFADQELMILESIEAIADKANCVDGDPFDITLITTQQPVSNERLTCLLESASKLRSDDSNDRQRGVAELVKHVDGTLQREFAILLTEICLIAANGRTGSKRAAMEVLAKIAPKGDSKSIEAASVCLSDHQEHVRLAALECMRALAPRGHKRAIAIGKRLASSGTLQTKAAAVMLLGEVACENSPGVMDLLTKCSTCDAETMQLAVLDALRLIWGTREEESRIDEPYQAGPE